MADADKAKERNRRDEGGLVTVRFGPKGTPDREALDLLEKIGKDSDVGPLALNHMIRLAVREYVERHRRKGHK